MVKSITFDLETLPTTDALEHLVRSPKGDQTLEEAFDLTALDGTLGRICCIGLQNADKGNCLAIYGSDEAQVVREFWRVAWQDGPPYLISHNGMGFDLPFLYKRSVILGVPCPDLSNYLKRFTTAWHYDTMAVWSNWDNRAAVKLDVLGEVLGCGRKTDIGSSVKENWATGKQRAVAEYCIGDAKLTTNVAARMRFLPLMPPGGTVIWKECW